MADDTPSVASHTSVLTSIINAIMHLAGMTPSGGGPAIAALQQAQSEIQSWLPKPEAPPAPPETWQANAPDETTGASLRHPLETSPPDPAHPETEADGDGPPVESPANPLGQPLDGSPFPEDQSAPPAESEVQAAMTHDPQDPPPAG